MKEAAQREVSEAAALRLAADARRRLGAGVGGGVAGPVDGGTDAGLTWVVVAGPSRTRAARLVGDRGPEDNRGDAIRTALRLCREVVGSR